MITFTEFVDDVEPPADREDTVPCAHCREHFLPELGQEFCSRECRAVAAYEEFHERYCND